MLAVSTETSQLPFFPEVASILPFFFFFLPLVPTRGGGGGGLGGNTSVFTQPISWQASAARCKAPCAGRYNQGKTASVSKSGKSNWLGASAHARKVVIRKQAFPRQSWQSRGAQRIARWAVSGEGPRARAGLLSQQLPRLNATTEPCCCRNTLSRGDCPSP